MTEILTIFLATVSFVSAGLALAGRDVVASLPECRRRSYIDARRRAASTLFWLAILSPFFFVPLRSIQDLAADSEELASSTWFTAWTLVATIWALVALRVLWFCACMAWALRELSEHEKWITSHGFDEENNAA